MRKEGTIKEHCYTGRYRKLLDDREIDHDLAWADGQRHVEYASFDDVLRIDPDYAGLEPGQKRTLTQWCATPGVVMRRHAPPIRGRVDDPMFAELRPLDAVRTGTRRHNFVDKNGELWAHHSKPFDELGKGWQMHVMRDEQPDDHHGTNNPADHKHVTEAKYLFPPGGKMWKAWENEDHTAHDAGWLSRHLSKWHDARETANETERVVHYNKVNDPEIERAKRLDVHPWGLDLFEDAETVWFVLEGCLKADAVLTDIRRRCAPEAVFSVPSVTLWDARELPAFVRQYLKGRTVYIVPDADWQDPSKDGAVWAQALYCRDALEQIGERAGFGVRAYITAPLPMLGGVKTKGIDDWLHAGGTMAGLERIDHRWHHEREVFGRQSDSATRNTRLMRFVALHANEEGEYVAPLATIAQRSGLNRPQVRAGLRELVAQGLLDSSKPLNTYAGQWIPWPRFNPYLAGGAYERPGECWEDMPVLTVPAWFRADTDRCEVGDQKGRAA